ncbi:MAG: hypothetical protein BWX48_02231 [Verrucomicrobia bacterium ADurb.Bin006]|nr:MAG: hypothetical protein BWX48_02231 [Verrucomicrobia bacterium ADurb.Bin006]
MLRMYARVDHGFGAAFIVVVGCAPRPQLEHRALYGRSGNVLVPSQTR